MKTIFNYTFTKEKPFPIIFNIYSHISLKKDKLIITSPCLIRFVDIKKAKLNKLFVIINNKQYNVDFLLYKSIKYKEKCLFNISRICIDIDDIKCADIQNKVVLKYGKYTGKIFYRFKDGIVGNQRNSKIIKFDNKAIYLRQSINNTLYLTIREINKYDKLVNKIKIYISYLLSKISSKKDIILLFEKGCSRYEESASILYEKLIDMSYNNIYYIINKDNTKLKEIDTKYKENIIYKDSFKHLIYFFRCNIFISTEALNHVIELRIANRLVNKKIHNKNNRYVFLQHGVTNMISLDSEARSTFRSLDYKLHKVVVNSDIEANNFIVQGGFKKKDLYMCGLPKFDKAIKYSNADKIVIMPTWRRWEVNEAISNPQETGYYKMIQNIIDAIPKKYKKNIIVLPHPLMLNYMKNYLDKYIPERNIIYDDILKTCSLLITDYSSVSYDAFYRGSNVIFYWEELEECLKKYGKNTKLLLNEENAFGDIAYNKEQLSNLIDSNYLQKQKQKHIKLFKNIVAFDDSKNTERLIKCLKKDNILKDK